MRGLIKMFFDSGQCVSVIEKLEVQINDEARNNRFTDAEMFRDPQLYLDRVRHLLGELAAGMPPDENDLVMLNRLSLIFGEVSQEAVKSHTSAGKLLIKRFGLAKGGYKPQMMQAILNGDKNLHKTYGTGKNAPRQMKIKSRFTRK